MPRTVPFARPSAGSCPVCDAGLTGPSCPRCGADLSGPAGIRLWQVDHHIHGLVAERATLVDAVLSRPGPAPAAPSATVGRTVAPIAAAPPLRTAPPPARPRPWVAPDPTEGGGPSVAEVLVGLGGLSLVAAVVVFAAVTWTDLAAWAQGGLLLTATLAVGVGAVACRRRDLVATSEALGAVTVALAVADVHVARVGLAGVVSPRAAWAAGLAIVAGGALCTGARTRLRSLSGAGAALAFLPAGILALGAPSGSVLVGALGAQALLACVVRDRTVRGRLEGAVAAVGATTSWVLAAAGGLVLTGSGLAHDPPLSPWGPATLLAALAAGSVVLGRRHHTPVLATAGAALAFVPPLVASLGAGSPLALLWVLALEGTGALALARRLPLSAGERVALDVCGMVTWSTTAAGGVLLGVAGLVDDPGRVPSGAVALLSVLAVASVAVGGTQRVVGLATAGAAIAFVPGVLAAWASGASAVLGVLVAQSTLGLVASVVGRRTGDPGRLGPIDAVTRAGAVASWLAAAAGSALVGVDALAGSEPSTPVVAVALLLALAGTACGAGVAAAWDRDAAGAALVAAVLTLLGAVALVQGVHGAEVAATTVALAAGALALGLASLVDLDRSRPWSAPLAVAVTTVAGVALLPLHAVVVVLASLADTAASATAGDASGPVADRLASSEVVAAEGGLPTAAALLQLASVALVGGGLWAARWRRAGVAVATAAGVATAVVLPVVLDLAVGPTVAGAALLVGAGAVVLADRRDDVIALAAEAVLVPLLLGVAIASVPLAIASTALVTLLVAGLAVVSVRSGAPAAPVWVGGAMACLLGTAVLDGVLLGATGSGPALVLAAAALVASVVAPALDRWGPAERRRELVLAADGVVAGGLALATVASPSADGVSVVLAIVAVTTGLAALRPRRRVLWLVSLSSALAVVWIRLAVAEIGDVEAYTLPLAGALLAADLLVRSGGRETSRSSWERLGPALVAALAPTAYLAVTEPDPMRTVAVVVAGVAVTLWGAVRREQAPLALGGAVVAAVALRHLGPVAAELPRWLVLAAAGVVLLAAGATFEQRRQDLRVARDAFTRLG